jgi:peptide/nickel transport system substrate-binding protein
MSPQGSNGISRRTAIALLASGITPVVLAACGTPAPPAPTPRVTPAAAAQPTTAQPAVTVGSPALTAPPTATPTVKSGGTIRTGQVGDIANLDGHYSNQLSNNTVQLAYDKLVAYDEALQPRPVLAESWDMSSDLKQVRLNLRHGVQFHNGREFTSDDVKYNITRVRDPKMAGIVATLGQQAAWFTTIDTPDKYTVVLTTDQPRPGVFDFLRSMNIVDRETMEGPDAKTAINGTGPFKFVEWTSGNHITMARNTSYWSPGRPHIDQLVISVMRDAQAMSTQFEAGSQDVMYAPALTDAARLKQDPGNQLVINYQLGSFFYVNVNVTNPLFANKLVRQAMNFALDRERISGTVLMGLVGRPVNLPWPDRSPAFDAAKNATYTFDLDKAAALLKQAGVSNAETEITYSTSGYASEYASIAQIYQADLAKIGVKTTLKPVDGPTFTQQGLTLTYAGLRIGAGGGSAVVDASSLLQAGNAYNYANNFSGFKAETYTQLVTAASTEVDTAKRKQLYSQLNDYLLDQCFTFAFSLYPSIVVVGPNVHNLQFDPSGVLGYADAVVG